MGPLATPPESKAIAVNIFGTKKDSPIATPYPGIKKHRIGIPVSTRIIASATDKDTPTDRETPMDLSLIHI